MSLVEMTLRIVRQSAVMAYDTETSGLDAKSFICGYVFTDWNHSVYVPVRHEAGGNIPLVEEFEAELAEAFKERGRLGYRTIMHNAAFDLKMSYRHGIELYYPLEDTQINEGLINDIAPGFSLDSCCGRYGVQQKLGDELYRELARRFGGLPDRKQMANFWKLPGDLPVAVEYATGDGTSTLELWRAQQPALDDERLIRGKPSSLRKVHKLECQLLPHLAKLNKRGIKIDQGYAGRVSSDLKASIAEARSVLPAGLAVRSPKEVEALFRSQGVDSFAQTAGGKPSFTEKWLETTELGRAILKVRQLENGVDSFITPLVDTHNVNWRVHPQLNQSKTDEYGAIGGRLSCSDPNLQAFPKRNKVVGNLVRPLVIPDFGEIYEMDAQQQEPRLFAHYSEDPLLLEGYNSMPPVDLHDNSMKLFGLGRDSAKRLGMGMLTGLQPKSLAVHMGYSVQEAERDHEMFLRAYPGIKQFQDTAKAVFGSRMEIYTILGRIAHLDDRRFAYRGTSRVIQGSGADHIKTVVLRACEFCEAIPEKMQMLLTIHDSIITQGIMGPWVKEMVRLMEDVQTPPFNLLVPIPFEVTKGANWAEASYGKKSKTAVGWVE